MNTWVLVVIVSMGYNFQKNPVALSSTVVPGFTTQQACENAKNQIRPESLGFDWTQVKIIRSCVPTTI